MHRSRPPQGMRPAGNTGVAWNLVVMEMQQGTQGHTTSAGFDYGASFCCCLDCSREAHVYPGNTLIERVTRDFGFREYYWPAPLKCRADTTSLQNRHIKRRLSNLSFYYLVPLLMRCGWFFYVGFQLDFSHTPATYQEKISGKVMLGVRLSADP